MVAFLGMGLGEWAAWIVATGASITALELTFRKERAEMAEAERREKEAAKTGEPAGRQNLDTEAMRWDAERIVTLDELIDYPSESSRLAHRILVLLDTLAAANERAGRYREALERIAAGEATSSICAMAYAKEVLDSDSQPPTTTRADAAGAMPDGPGDEQGGGED